MKKQILFAVAALISLSGMAQEPAKYRITYDCDAQSVTGSSCFINYRNLICRDLYEDESDKKTVFYHCERMATYNTGMFGFVYQQR